MFSNTSKRSHPPQTSFSTRLKDDELEVQKSKRELRSQLRVRLKDLTNSEAEEQTRQIGFFIGRLVAHLQESATIPVNFLIGVYAPLSNEVDWSKGKGKAQGMQLSYPGLKNDQMVFQKCETDQLIETCDFGVPVMTPPDQAPEVTPDLILVPGLGFSKLGHRLGRGRGFYDKYLENFEGIKVGLAFREQLLESIPTETHDVVMDYIVSSSGIFGEQGELDLNIKEQ